jgi:hypothetical protein
MASCSSPSSNAEYALRFAEIAREQQVEPCSFGFKAGSANSSHQTSDRGDLWRSLHRHGEHRGDDSLDDEQRVPASHRDAPVAGSGLFLIRRRSSRFRSAAGTDFARYPSVVSAANYVDGGEKLVHFGVELWTGRMGTLCSGQLRNATLGVSAVLCF